MREEPIEDTTTVRFPGYINTSGTGYDVTKLAFNPTSLNAYLDSLTIDFMNKSAVITFQNVVMGSPVAVIDYNDSGTFFTCPIELCPYQSYVGNVFTFNVTHWTNYSVSSNSTSIFIAPSDPSTSSNFNFTGSIAGDLPNGTQTNSPQTITVSEKNTGRLVMTVTGFFSTGNVDLNTATISVSASKTAINLTGTSNIGGTHEIFVPVDTQQGVYVCPDAKFVSEVSSNCAGVVSWDFTETGGSGTTKTVGGDSVKVTNDGSYYNVSGLSGSGAGEGMATNLTIWDETDPAGRLFSGQTRLIGETVVFLANFTNSSLMPANTTNGGCKIDFAAPAYDGYEDMTYNSTYEVFMFERTFASAGTLNWKVNCSADGDIASASDTVSITSSGVVPEFGTWALLLALGVVAIGMTQRGRFSKR